MAVMTEIIEIETDYAIPAGEYIQEWLEENNWTQARLARAVGVTPKHISKLIAGARLTHEVAIQLEFVTGIAARIWMSYENTYREDVARLALQHSLEEHVEIARAFPLKDMRARGLISGNLRKPGEVLMELMAFFRVGSLDGLNARTQPVPAFRQALSHSVDPGAVQVWLRLIEMELEQSEPLDVPFDRDMLEAVIPDIRKLSADYPEDFGARLVHLLASAGVRLLFINDVPGARVHGCTQWFGGTPVVTLSTRGKDDGKFWFTLFHEIGHVLRHEGNRMFIQADSGKRTPHEDEADEFARDTLIPPEFVPELRTLNSKTKVRSFARRIGTCPGVVVGRMHREQVWDFRFGQDLFQKLVISDDEEAESS
ncbi:hypothetical protein C3B78_08115 [Arthrobacter sp. PGP41]|nr:hypothetical protein C3B78_08115 [Arthrobacter sp. PGP41]